MYAVLKVSTVFYWFELKIYQKNMIYLRRVWHGLKNYFENREKTFIITNEHLNRCETQTKGLELFDGCDDGC